MNFSDELNKIGEENSHIKNNHTKAYDNKEFELRRVLNDCRECAKKGLKYTELDYCYDSKEIRDFYLEYLGNELIDNKYGFKKVKLRKPSKKKEIEGIRHSSLDGGKYTYHLYIFVSWLEKNEYEATEIKGDNSLEDEWDKLCNSSNKIRTIINNIKEKNEEFTALHPAWEAILPSLIILSIIIILIIIIF